jgi:hypothetical protein
MVPGGRSFSLPAAGRLRHLELQEIGLSRFLRPPSFWRKPLRTLFLRPNFIYEISSRGGCVRGVAKTGRRIASACVVSPISQPDRRCLKIAGKRRHRRLPALGWAHRDYWTLSAIFAE